MCYEMASGQLVKKDTECGPAKHNSGLSCVQGETSCIRDALKELFPQLNEQTSVFRPKWICKLSTMYKEKSFIIIGSDGLDPVFGRIEDILVIAGDYVLFVVVVFNVLYFESHYHAYALSITSNKKVVSLSNLSDYNVYHSHKMSDGLSYITLKYYFLP